MLCITNNLIKHHSFVCTLLKYQTPLFQTIQFTKSHLFAIILNVKQLYLTYRTLSGATTPSQSGPGSDGNEGVLRIPQGSCIFGTLPLDYLLSYPGHSLEVSFSSTEIQLVYSTTPDYWAMWEFITYFWSILFIPGRRVTACVEVL